MRCAPTISLCIAAASTGSWAQCPNQMWSSEFASPSTSLSHAGTSLTVFDADGPGPLPPELYAGGYFLSAAGLPGTRGIARWNGAQWSSVGGGVNGTVTALGVFDADGPGPGLPVLVASGTFTAAGGIPARRNAAWNGSQWTSIGFPTSIGGTAEGMAEFDPDGPGPATPELWLAGSFGSTIGSDSPIARWNGQAWSLMPGMLGIALHAIAVYDEDGPGPRLPTVFVGLSGSPGVWRWDGDGWDGFGGGLGRSGWWMGRSLRVVDEDGPGPGLPVLLAGGQFALAGGAPALAIARWNGQVWSSMGEGIGDGSARVDDILAVDDTGGAGPPTIYADGRRDLGPRLDVRSSPMGSCRAALVGGRADA